jgi:diguanylate cyclase (GGDEF)-like protein
MQAKWERLGVAPLVLRLGNLSAIDLAGMLAEMLRLSPVEASRLAVTLDARTGGNPFDTVELVNALRRDGLLVPRPDGWNWDDAAIRRYIGRGEVDFLTSRLAALPRVARQLLELVACLGGDVGIRQLQASTGLTIGALEDRLAPAFEDVDHFKLYNDRYGHVAGDLCLRRVAEALGSSVRRDVDLVARYGGEEFAMILPGAHRSAVHRVGERALVVVAALEEPHPRAAGGFVTISAGVAATVPSAQSSAEELIECADAALYEAKRAGRNQVCEGDARVSLDDLSV